MAFCEYAPFWGLIFFFSIDHFIKIEYTVYMTKNLEKIATEDLHLTGARKERFIREALALRANLTLRRKQQEKRKKCTHSK